MSEIFWLSYEQFSRLKPFLPTDTRGVARVDDRRVISGIVHGDKGNDSTATRHRIEELGCIPNILPKSNRKWKKCFSPYLYRGRNAIERMFGRLKDFRRIATGYDRQACNYLAAVSIAAIICYWL